MPGVRWWEPLKQGCAGPRRFTCTDFGLEIAGFQTGFGGGAGGAGARGGSGSGISSQVFCP